MKLNSPVPQSLQKECAKAAKIFKSFVDSGNNGLDGVIPRHILENARGFAIFTIFKAGFLFSARGGSGIVIARLDDGTWSCPSAIGTAGLGFGGQAGAEMTDVLIVLNSRSALRSFMAAGSLQLGGNLSIAVGPIGRNGEAMGALNTGGKVAAMYSYSKTRGLFGGLSVEGSVIVERQDANAQAYGNPNVTVKLLLGGHIDHPPWTAPLVQTLTSCTGLPGNRQWVHDDSLDSPGYAFNGLGSPQPSGPGQLKKKKKDKYPPDTWGQQTQQGSYFLNEDDFVSGSDPVNPRVTASNSGNGFATHFESDFVPTDTRPTHRSGSQSMSAKPEKQDWFDSIDTPFAAMPTASSMSQGRSMSLASPRRRDSNEDPFGGGAPPAYISPKPQLSKPLTDGVGRAIALYDFHAVESGDLSFSKGDVITIIEKSDSSDDWWTGRIDSRQGIFPANFVEVV